MFGLCHLLGFRFARRIRDLADRRLYTAEKAKRYPTLRPFIGGTINLKQLLAQWSEILRLGCSIRLGTVPSSLILRKLASYPRQNALALALREFGRIERTLFTLDWLLDKDLRQRVTAGLNKGELKNSLAKAVCFNRLGELRNVTAQAASTWWSPRLSCGIPYIWSARSGRFANKGGKSTKAYSSIWRRSIGTTLTSPAITPGGRTNTSRRAVFGHSGSRPKLSVLYFPFRQRTPYRPSTGARRRRSEQGQPLARPAGCTGQSCQARRSFAATPSDLPKFAGGPERKKRCQNAAASVPVWHVDRFSAKGNCPNARRKSTAPRLRPKL